MKRRVSKKIIPLSTNASGSEYYENIYDDANMYLGLEPGGQPGDKLSYMQLQEGVYSVPGNEYLEIRDDYYRKSVQKTDVNLKKSENDYNDIKNIGTYETLTQNACSNNI